MSAAPGYTTLQARAICGGIDRDMARIEDAALRMRRRVTDHTLSADRQLEELRELAESLKALVDRRTARGGVSSVTPEQADGE